MVSTAHSNLREAKRKWSIIVTLYLTTLASSRLLKTLNEQVPCISIAKASVSLTLKTALNVLTLTHFVDTSQHDNWKNQTEMSAFLNISTLTNYLGKNQLYSMYNFIGNLNATSKKLDTKRK